jgi:hypothetical protein
LKDTATQETLLFMPDGNLAFDEEEEVSRFHGGSSLLIVKMTNAEVDFLCLRDLVQNAAILDVKGGTLQMLSWSGNGLPPNNDEGDLMNAMFKQNLIHKTQDGYCYLRIDGQPVPMPN